MAAFSLHVPQAEVPILDRLVTLRHRLHLLKRTSTQPATEVLNGLRDEVSACVDELLAVRPEGGEGRSRVDDVLDDVFQLLSLFYLSQGKTRDAPATYVQLVTIKQCLLNLDASGVYTQDDLTPYRTRLKDLESILHLAEKEEGNGDGTPKGFHILTRKRLSVCQRLLKKLATAACTLDPCLVPYHTRLVALRRDLLSLDSMQCPTTAALTPLKKEARSLENLRVNGKFPGPNGEIPEKGQEQLEGEKEGGGEGAEEDRPKPCQAMLDLQEKLQTMRSSLERWLLTRRWTLREPDLWEFQVQLQSIGAMRKGGKFLDSQGQEVPGQEAVNWLLQRCWRLIYRLLSSAVPVSEPLVDVHNQLLTLRRCLVEVRKLGGPFTLMELYPYQIKLSQIDNQRQDGAFLDEEGNVPEGQGVVMSLLNECYDILYELKNEADKDEEDEEEEEEKKKGDEAEEEKEK
ncbi:MAG: hypothetical protein DHS80DRAFT_15802 [Piptocephalis tieghemiana]|nr:MAG: hypothetical protein DHS80DRAFT_15802 [Piptocephalis tieghemiana]